MVRGNVAIGNGLANEMIASGDMFAAGVMLWILGQGLSPFIVDVQWYGRAREKMKFRQEVGDPKAFTTCIRQGFVFGLRARK